jgi:hypothetical protein
MKRKPLYAALLVFLLTCSTWAMAPEKGVWRAASKNAKSITGDVAIADEKLSLNFYSFPMAQIRALTPAEIGAAFDADTTAPGSGNLYRLSIPGTKKLLNKNTLCGSDDTQWMAAYVLGKNLQLAFFSGPTMPVFTPEAFANATNVCGTFSYVK